MLVNEAGEQAQRCALLCLFPAAGLDAWGNLAG